MVVAVEMTIATLFLRDAKSIPALPLVSLQTVQIVVHFHERVVGHADDIIVDVRVDHDVVAVAAAVVVAAAVSRE